MEDWEIDPSQVTIHKKIGSGSFGTVYCGYYFGKFFSAFRLLSSKLATF